MEKKYKDFLTNKNLVESRIIEELSKLNGYGITDLKRFFKKESNDLLKFIEYYEREMCTFERKVTNFDIERVMGISRIDCAFELLNSLEEYDASDEIISLDNMFLDDKLFNDMARHDSI